MLALLRDPRVGTHCSVAPHPAISVSMELPASESQQVAGVTAVTAGAPSQPGASQASPATVTAPFPPCGVLLPQGSVLLAAPLCFLHDSPAAVYRLHRALYCRYCRSGSLSQPVLQAGVQVHQHDPYVMCVACAHADKHGYRRECKPCAQVLVQAALPLPAWRLIPCTAHAAARL